MSGAGVICGEEAVEAHPERSSAMKVRLTAANFIFLLSMTVIITACAGPKIRAIDLIGEDFRFLPETIRVNEGDTVQINFSNPDVVPHLIDLPAFNQHIALLPGGAFTLEFVADKPGSFQFVCSVPGHEEAGMVGIFVVDPKP
ncbi:MAG: cupredoxin domain-containing protein [Chloroflexi bacterium]|nr:cupredoxin domain-containing protein [Chloroflexota bacterium]